MRQFFLKKSIFAACFLACLGVFSLWNLLSCRETLQELGRQLGEIRSFGDLKQWIADAEEESVDEIIWKMNFIETYGYVNELLGKREMQDFRYVKDLDGIANYGSAYPVMEDTWEYAVRVRKLTEYAKQHGMKVLFLSPPSKVMTGVSNLEEDSLVNDTNPVQDQFLWQLQQNRVPALDLRTPLKNTGMTSTELFFRSDHHWRPEAAFEAVRILVDEIRERYGDDWDPDGFYCDPGNYNRVTYGSCELGSVSRNAGAVYGGADDFTLIWPDFETDFYWKALDREGKTSVYEGDMTESLLRLDVLGSSNIYKVDPYLVYVNTVDPMDEIVNRNHPDGPSLLVLRDSYFAPMACFLAPMCSRMDMAWSKSDESRMDISAWLQERIGSGDYDYLIIELYPYSLVEDESFPYFTDPEQEVP